MKKWIVAVIVAVVALGTIGYIVFANNDDTAEAPPATTTQDDTSSNTDQSTDTNTSNTDNGNQNTNDGSAVQSDEVEIEDFAFTPATITVKKGTTVTWTNKDTTSHNITPDQVYPGFEASELLDRDESYSVTFDTVGTYTYHCSPHPYMKGTVEVTE